MDSVGLQSRPTEEQTDPRLFWGLTFFGIIMFWLYILYSSKIDKYHTGIISVPDALLQSHNEIGNDWTVSGRPGTQNIFLQAKSIEPGALTAGSFHEEPVRRLLRVSNLPIDLICFAKLINPANFPR